MWSEAPGWAWLIQATNISDLALVDVLYSTVSERERLARFQLSNSEKQRRLERDDGRV